MSKKAKTTEPKQPGIDFVVPLEVFQLKLVQAVLDPTAVVGNFAVDQRVRAARDAAGTDKNIDAGQALNVLSQVTSYHLNADDKIEPFGPVAIFEGRRSPIPSDLLSDQVVILAQLVPEIGHPALRARLADVCWLLNRRDVSSGLFAVSGYVECVRMVLNGEAKFDFDQANAASVSSADLLTRAANIARRMGWGRTDFDCLRATIDHVCEHAIANDDGWGFIHVGPVNLAHQIWKPEKTAKAAEALAISFRPEGDNRGRRLLWEIAGQAYRRAGDNDSSNRALIEAAETHVADADLRTDSAFVQVHFLNEAIQALRPLPGTVARRRELQDRMSALQALTHDEMRVFEMKDDITELVKASEKEVRGKILSEVIRTLFTCARSPDPTKLREDALKEGYGSISALFSTKVSDHQGRIRFIAPGLAPNGEPDKNQVLYLVNQRDQIRRHLIVASAINPIRRVLWEEHSVTAAALTPLMQMSPFVPPNHETVFALGAAKFIGGDEIEAAHLILPQLENSLRHLLSLAGVETNRLNQDGTQEEAMLSRLLGDYREQLLAILPRSIVEEIDLLFNFKGGPSIRHELAHGKMSDGDFWARDVTYSIWLVLQLVTLPTLQHWNEVAQHIEEYAR